MRASTCCSVLRFEEGPYAHVVKNVLIDQAAIERTVLTHTQRDALEVVRNGSLWCDLLHVLAAAGCLRTALHAAPPLRARGRLAAGRFMSCIARSRKTTTPSQPQQIISCRRQYTLANAYSQDGSVAYLRGKTQISRPPPPGLRRPRLVRDVSQQVGLAG